MTNNIPNIADAVEQANLDLGTQPFLGGSLVRRVGGSGPLNARIVVVAEYPEKGDDAQGEFLSGGQGRILDYLLHQAGIIRADCYFTGLIKYIPPTVPRGKDRLGPYWKGKNPKPELIRAKNDLIDELKELNPNIIICLGSHALWAIAGERLIGNWRGSIVKVGEAKVMGTYSPESVMNNWGFRPIVAMDLTKAKKYSNDKILIEPFANLITRPTLHEALSFLSTVYDSKRYAYDIETANNQITCISFCADGRNSMSIPTDSYWNEDELVQIIKRIDSTFQSPALKIAQNSMYDLAYIMRIWNIIPKQPWFDTMIAQYCCYPEFQKSLGFLTSMYTDFPYFKGERVLAHDSGDIDRYWRYNAKDSLVTYIIADEIEKEMAELGVTKIYNTYMDVIEPLLFMSLRGLKVNPVQREKVTGVLQKNIEKLDEMIALTMPGVNINSAKQMMEFFYGVKNIRPYKLKGKPTLNKATLYKIAVRYNLPEAKLIIESRKAKKLKSTYADAKLDPEDNRMKASFRVGGDAKEDEGSKEKQHKTGRISSGINVWGQGTNLQNQPKKVGIRDMFLPDFGMFTEADFKQAEAMLVAYITEDPPMMKLFEDSRDIHTLNASNLFGIEYELVTEAQRGKAKTIIHGTNYRMGAALLAEIMGIEVREAEQHIHKYYNTYMGIPRWHHEVEEQIRATRIITTCLGHRRQFFGRIDHELINDAISYEPQTTVGGLMLIGLKRLFDATKKYKKIACALTVHDNVIIDHQPEDKPMIIELCHKHLEIPITVHGRTFTIPIDFKHGPNWGEMK